ncbi:cytochrome [Hafnia paralvei]|uniref:cytochrome n=1 Tax=Hafnia paralvei TaxID=546367 RepID=UPI0024BA02AB|nr:cytochrome [Hafnia paralvei]
MNFEEMFKDLIPERKAIKFGNHTFYVRPMTVSEFTAHVHNPNKSERDDIAIFNCVQDESGASVFSSVDEVKSLYTTVRSALAGEVAVASVFMPPNEVEKK